MFIQSFFIYLIDCGPGCGYGWHNVLGNYVSCIKVISLLDIAACAPAITKGM